MRLPPASRSLAGHLCLLAVCHLILRLGRDLVPSTDGIQRYFPHSRTGAENEENQERTLQAEKMLKEQHWNIEIDQSYEVRILASNRKLGYLTQVVGFLLDSYGLPQSRPKISICNVERSIFEELQQFKDKLDIYQMPGPTVNSSWPELSRRISKETWDYHSCLSLKTNARFVLLLEDDALVVPQFSSMMTSLVNQLDRRSHAHYVKMYHPVNLRKLPSLPMAIAVSVAVVALFQYVIFRRLSLILFVVCSFVIYVDLRSYTSQFISDVRYSLSSSVYLSMPESCCTPAVLFRSSIKDQIAEYMHDQSSYEGHAKDHILDESPFEGRQTDSNLVVHIGAFSSIRQRVVQISETKPGNGDRKEHWWQYLV